MEKITASVRNVRQLCDEIFEFTLVDPNGERLPSFDPGSHIDVFVADKIVRQYSLIGSGATTHEYRIAVQREMNGRGGSVRLVQDLRSGSTVDISRPRNNFKLQDAEEVILLAGGIGITPLIGMAEYLSAQKKKFSLYYFCRSKNRQIAIHELCSSIDPKVVKVHCDEDQSFSENPLEKLLSVPRENTHIYFCGPNGFMNRISELTSLWPQENLHKESFSAEPVKLQENSESFDIKLLKSGRVITVDPSETILSACKRSGIEVSSSCESGLCGSCKVRYTQGTPLHHDLILSDEERETYMLVCVSRASSKELVLDL